MMPRKSKQSKPLQPLADTKKTVSVPRPPRTNSSKFAQYEPLANQICGLSDPFCVHAGGAKYPDDSSIRTLPFSYHFTIPISSNPGGSGAYLFWPRIGSDGTGVVNNASAAGVTVTPAATFDNSLVPNLVGFTSYRIVSCGFKLRRVSPLLSTSGMLFVRSHAIDNATEFTAFNGSTYSASKTVDVAIIDCQESCFIHEHTSQMPQAFYDPTVGTLAGATVNGFSPISILISGAPASITVMQLEYFMHVELVFSPTASLALAATASVPASTLVTSAVNRITSSASLFFHEAAILAGKAIREKALSFLATALRSSPNPTMKAMGMIAAPYVD